MDYVDIGPVPVDELCIQAPYGDRRQAAHRETLRFKWFLEYVFSWALSDVEGNARFAVRLNSHDFGSYYSLVVEYAEEPFGENNLGAEFAYFVEGNTPLRWVISKGEIAELKNRWLMETGQPVPTEEDNDDGDTLVTVDESGQVLEIRRTDNSK